MGYWEFLLQKEGDQTWLPLDTAQVEILEGRYRIMAHTSLADTPVTVQISHLGVATAPVSRGGDRPGPRRRTLRRQAQTNDKGLIVVMPFTRLGEGTWEVLCAGGAEADSWRYRVHLQVVAQEAASDGDWFADDGGAALPPFASAPPQTPPLSLEPQGVAAALEEFQGRQSAGAAPADHQLRLAQTAMLAQVGDTLTLGVSVQGPPPPAGEALALAVRLSDPQTATSIGLTVTALAVVTLPAEAAVAVAVPTDLTTRLLLGEVALLAGSEVVALQGFTVTVDVASLFNAIANQAEANAELGVVFPADEASSAATSSPKPLDLVEPAAPPRQLPSLTLPRSSPALPPKIYYPSPHEAAARQPNLPLARRPASNPETTTDSGPPGDRTLSLPPVNSPARSEDPVATLSGRSPVAPQRSPQRPPALISHEAMGFKSLNLQERFWTRLNQLAVTLQQEAAPAAAEAPPATDSAPEIPDFVPFAGEVVIYADEDPTLMNSQPSAASPAAEGAAIAPPPVPTLTLPEGTLTAGEAVVVTLQVPFHPNRLYLKVWITDPQTRTLVDEPRQVMNLRPNGRGQLEASLQLSAPQGCLEAWFEAIAVDMITQQESYKASVSRAILPAGLPTGSDDFLI